MAKNYDSLVCEGATEIFGEELMQYFFNSLSSLAKLDSLEMEYKLTQVLSYLNRKYNNIQSVEDEKRFWALYEFGIGFLTCFYEYDFSFQKEKDLAYFLLEYMLYGRCNPEFVLEAYRNIKDMYEDIKLL